MKRIMEKTSLCVNLVDNLMNYVFYEVFYGQNTLIWACEQLIFACLSFLIQKWHVGNYGK